MASWGSQRCGASAFRIRYAQRPALYSLRSSCGKYPGEKIYFS